MQAQMRMLMIQPIRMKNSVIPLSGILLLTISSWVGTGAHATGYNPDELKRLVDASKFEEAKVLLEQSDDPSAAAFYNRGYVAFRMGQTGKAVAYFEKASQLAPSDDDTRHNLLLARQRLLNETGLKTLDPASGLLERFSEGIPVEGVKNVWGLVSLLLVFAWLRGFALKRSLRHSIFRPVALILFLAWTATTLVWSLGKSPSRHSAAVAIEASVIRSGPGPGYTELTRVVAGVKVVKLGPVQPGWIQVRYDEDGIGWVESANVLAL